MQKIFRMIQNYDTGLRGKSCAYTFNKYLLTNDGRNFN